MIMSNQESTENIQLNTGFENYKDLINCNVGDRVFLRGRELNKSQEEVYQFLREKRVEEVFNFLIEHLLVNTPRYPLNFLVDILDKCINFRDNLKDPPLLFDRSHQESIYKAFDPGNRGFVTQPQYCEALKTVGLGDSSLLPSMNKNSIIFKNEFLIELDRALINHLYSMLGGVRKDINIPTAVRGSLQYKDRHRVQKTDSASLLLKNALKKSSVRFFLAMNEGLDKCESPEQITHSEFYEHISRKSSKYPDDLPETPSDISNEQGLKECSSGRVNGSSHDETEYFVNKEFMHHKSVEELVSLNSLPLADGNESIKSFPSCEMSKQEAKKLSSGNCYSDEDRMRLSGSLNSKLENTGKSYSSFNDLEVASDEKCPPSSEEDSKKEYSKSSEDIVDSM